MTANLELIENCRGCGHTNKYSNQGSTAYFISLKRKVAIIRWRKKFEFKNRLEETNYFSGVLRTTLDIATPNSPNAEFYGGTGNVT